jgi:anti-sigma regulatory factor (Ser/Thr protein kinase)
MRGHPWAVLTQTGMFRISFTADPVELIFFRGGLNQWLIGLQWPEPDRIDAVLAVSEACDNCVRHAYRADREGEVEVTGRLTVDPAGRRIVVVVRDRGQREAGRTGRGFGMTTMQACMDQVRIRHSPDGTVVTLTSRPVPLLGAPTADDG